MMNNVIQRERWKERKRKSRTRRKAGRSAAARWRNRDRWAAGRDWRAASGSSSCACWGRAGAVPASSRWRCRASCSSWPSGWRPPCKARYGTSDTSPDCEPKFSSSVFLKARPSFSTSISILKGHYSSWWFFRNIGAGSNLEIIKICQLSTLSWPLNNYFSVLQYNDKDS